MKRQAFPILGVKVSLLTYQATLTTITKWIGQQERTYVCVAAVHLLMECQNNPQLRRGVNHAGLVTPDGMPLVWLARLSGQKNIARVYGPTLMLKLCALAQSKGWKIFLLGGDRGQGQLLLSRLKLQFPRLSIVGTRETPGKLISKRANLSLVRQINKLKPQVVLLGLGCPYQEMWMIENRKKLRANVLIGVGAAFDLLTGKEKQAPHWIQALGLEWLFRLAQNPQRLWYRYLVLNTKFIGMVVAEALVRRVPFLE